MADAAIRGGRIGAARLTAESLLRLLNFQDFAFLEFSAERPNPLSVLDVMELAKGFEPPTG